MAAPATRARILLVGEKPEALHGRLDALREAGYDAVAATTRSDALNAAFTMPPAAVIIDLTSSDLDGFALTLALRGDQRTRNLPIVGMISAWSPEVRAHAARAGVCVLLLEPCVHEHLLAEIRRALQPARPHSPSAARAVTR